MASAKANQPIPSQIEIFSMIAKGLAKLGDSYDPEWGTSAIRSEIAEAIDKVYAKVSQVLRNEPPIYIVDLVHKKPDLLILATLTELEWRMIRFCLERAKLSL